MFISTGLKIPISFILRVLFFFFKSESTLMFYHISTLFSIGGKFLILHFFPLNLMVMVALTHIVEPFAE